MEEISADTVREIVYSSNEEFQTKFREHFETEVEAFVVAFARTYDNYKKLDSIVRDSRSAWVQAFLFSSLNNLLISTHLLVSGFLIQAGNSMRQFAEALSMALLCSHKSIDTFKRFEEHPKRYPIHNALNELTRKRNLELLNLDGEGLAGLKEITRFYDQYSHASALGVANVVMLESEGVVLGSCFDPAKLEMYGIELSRRRTAPEPVDQVIDRIREILQGESATDSA